MSVKMKPGVWKRRDGLAVAVRHKEGQNCPWIGSDGKTRYDDGRWMRYENTDADLVEYIDVPPKPEPQPQPDAADELAALRDDRDRWQARAKQAEGQASNLAKQLVGVRGELREKTQQWTDRVRQVSDLQAQLEAAAQSPDLRSDIERVAAERDAAREEVRGLQVRAEQAEGDARQATAKMRHHEGEASKWRAQVTVTKDQLLRAEAANDALQVVILNIIRELRNDD